MAVTHNLGMPRIGAQRELKRALESYWKGDSSPGALVETATSIQEANWALQSKLDWIPVGDFSLYDHVLDTSFALGLLPSRIEERGLSDYFRLARGRVHGDAVGVHAAEMTKWFDTNYHFIVPEIEDHAAVDVWTERVVRPFAHALEQGVNAKPVLLGPITFLWLAKEKGGLKRLELLPQVIEGYRKILEDLAFAGANWVQLDEPILSLEVDEEWKSALRTAYETLAYAGPKVLLAAYFGSLKSNLLLAAGLPSHGLHLDTIRGRADLDVATSVVPQSKVLSLGVVDGRNIWKTDLNASLDWLERVHDRRGDRLWVAPSCSLLHVPVDLDQEIKMDVELRSWLAFAKQKIEEVSVLGRALNRGRDAVRTELEENAAALASRRASSRVHDPDVRKAVEGIVPRMVHRKSHFEARSAAQRNRLNLPEFPTTTIGSFPQTSEIRKARRDYKRGVLSFAQYESTMKGEIGSCIERQESLGLDVLVHGEAERNDMVEYFGEQLSGFAFSEFGWVQSYGSRCVKPPILYGDVSRPKPMTVEWIKYAQSLTSRPVKGMLTGPVTILNWSFVRDDQPRKLSCRQIALAMRKEVLDLEAAGIAIVQIDEAALREGLPLRKAEWNDYLEWAVGAFRLTASGVQDETQIHTHMCYSEFNDIIRSIAYMDADVITIETSRSDMELLDAFDTFNYPNEIGPGVYDIHSPNIPSSDQMTRLMKSAARRIPAERLWVNPDCGLKTRKWDEVIPALHNMVQAAKELRAQGGDSKTAGAAE